jgi:hypothetical protein
MNVLKREEKSEDFFEGDAAPDAKSDCRQQ